MAGDESITNAELARQIAAMRQDQHDDLTEIKVRLAQLVPREVYDAQRQTDAAEIRNLKDRITSLESRARWLVAAVVVPILVVILNWLLTAKGVKS